MSEGAEIRAKDAPAAEEAVEASEEEKNDLIDEAMSEEEAVVEEGE